MREVIGNLHLSDSYLSGVALSRPSIGEFGDTINNFLPQSLTARANVLAHGMISGCVRFFEITQAITPGGVGKRIAIAHGLHDFDLAAARHHRHHFP